MKIAFAIFAATFAGAFIVGALAVLRGIAGVIRDYRRIKRGVDEIGGEIAEFRRKNPTGQHQDHEKRLP